jgi:hypothetical protein
MPDADLHLNTDFIRRTSVQTQQFSSVKLAVLKALTTIQMIVLQWTDYFVKISIYLDLLVIYLQDSVSYFV